MKSIIRILVLVTTMTVLSDMALAVETRGATSCGKWVEDEKKVDSKTSINFGRTWIVAYLSGLAVGNNTEFWAKPNANALDAESVFLWVDNYCKANPLKDIGDAGIALFLERAKSLRK